MDRTIKQVIAGIVTVFLVAVAVWGSYMPMRKAQMFIGALQSIQAEPPSSLQDLESRVTPSLDYPAPIGQEELVRNLANSVLGFVQNTQNASSTGGLLDFLYTYYDPILARGKGMSFGQDLYLVGAIDEIAYVHTGDPADLQGAGQYYQEGHVLGPERPQPLYGLFDVYRFEGDATDTISTGEEILSLWPTDTNVQQGLAQFEAGVAAKTAGK